MIGLSSRPPIDALMQVDVHQVCTFAEASGQIREQLQMTEGVLVEAYRGAAPLFWAAAGLEEFEDPPLTNARTVPIPIGSYQYTEPGTTKTVQSGCTKTAKATILRTCLEGVPEVEAGLTILDEVQMGGTVLQLAHNTISYARHNGLPLPVRVIAGEDTGFSKTRTGRYKNMAAGHKPDVTVASIPLPLVATDRDSLLPTIVYSGGKRKDNEDETVSNLSIIPNTEAELLIRCIGTMARRPQIARDTKLLSRILEGMTSGISTSVRNDWLHSISCRMAA